MKTSSNPKSSSFLQFAPKQIKLENFGTKQSQSKMANKPPLEKKFEPANDSEIFIDDINCQQTQDFKPDIRNKTNKVTINRNSASRTNTALNKNNSTDNAAFNYVNANYQNYKIVNKLQKANSSLISTGEDTQRSRYASSKEKTYSKKTSPNPKINQHTYIPADNKFLKMKISKAGGNVKNLSSKGCLTSRPSSVNGNSVSTSSTSTLNGNIKNSTLRLIYSKEEELNKSRNDKLKQIEKKSDLLYKKKTFSTDNETRERVKKEIDQLKIKKELENCTFKPKIHRNSISAFTSRTGSPMMTAHNSIRETSFNNPSSTYDRQMEWKSKVKSR